jgi:hypothetical protein
VIDDLSKLLKQVTSPADMAVVLLAGTAGFVVDAGLNVVGFLSPGVVGVTAATGALGVKRTFDAYRQRRRDLRAIAGTSDGARDRAERLVLWLIKHDEPTPIADGLRREIDLYDEGVTSADDLQDALDLAIEAIRQAGPDESSPSLDGGIRRRGGAGVRGTLDG